LVLRQLDNPWAEHRFTADVPWPRLAFKDQSQRLVAFEGAAPADLFGLPNVWSLGEAFSDDNSSS
jgi:hypothetical protein